MPPVTPVFTAHEKFYLATYLLGKKTFADMKKDLPALATDLLIRAAKKEVENPDEFRKIFGEVEDARVFFGGVGGVDREALVGGVGADAQAGAAGTVTLPGAAGSVKDAYKAIPGIGPDIIGETLKALEEYAKTNPAQKADYDLLTKYISDNALKLRAPLTQAVLQCMRADAAPAENAIGNAIRVALLEASHPEEQGGHPQGSCPNQGVYEMLGTRGEGWAVARAGVRRNDTLAEGAVGIQAIDTKLRANVGKEVLLALAAGLEGYAQQSVAQNSPDALHRAAAVAAAKTLRGEIRGDNTDQQIAVAHAISRNLVLGNVDVGGNIATAVNRAIQGATAATAGLVGAADLGNDGLLALNREVWAGGKTFAANPAPPAEKVAEVSTNLHQLLTEAGKELAKDTSDQGKTTAREFKESMFDKLEKATSNAEEDLRNRMDAIAKAAEVQANAVGNNEARQRSAGVGLQTLANWQQYENEHLLKTDALMSQLLGGANVADVLKGFDKLKTETVADVFEAKMKAAVGFDQLTEADFDKAKIIQARLAQDTLDALEALAKLQVNRGAPNNHVENWLLNAVNDVRKIVGTLSGKDTFNMGADSKDVGHAIQAGTSLPRANMDNIHLALFHLHRISSGLEVGQDKAKTYANAAFTSMGYVEVARATASRVATVAADPASAAVVQREVLAVITQQKDKLPGGDHSLAELNTTSQEDAIISAYKRLAEEIASQGIVSSHNEDIITISDIIGKTAATRTELEKEPVIDKKRNHYYQKHIYVDYTPANLAKKQAEMLTIRKGGVAAVKVTMEKAFDLWPHGIVVNGGKVGGKERREILRLSLLHVLEGNGSFTVEMQNPKPDANEQKEIELISKLGKAIQKYQSDMPAGGNSPYEKMMVEARNAANVAVAGDIPADNNKANAKILLKVLRASRDYFKDKPEAIVLEMARNLKILGKVGVNEHTKEAARKRVAAIIVSTKGMDLSAKGIDSETRDGILTKLTDMYDNFGRHQAENPLQGVDVVPGRNSEGTALVKVVEKMEKAVEAAMQLETKNPLTKFLHKGAELKEDRQEDVNNMAKPF